eukprot:499739_1
METIDELHQEQSIDYEQFIDTTTITVDEHKEQAYEQHDTVLQLQIKAKEILDQLMVAEKDALKKRKEAIKMNGEVEIEMKAINERTANVEAELAEAKPALEASQK